MNHEDMSDFELSKAVASIIKLNICDGQHYSPNVSYWDDNGHCKMFGINNPSDIWPIIVEAKIETCWFCGDKWRAIIDNQFQAGEYKKWVAVDANPLRAAAIVYLKMMEAKNAD